MDKLFRLFQGEVTPAIRCDNFAPACLSDFSALSNILLPLIYLIAALLALGLFLLGAIRVIQAKGDPARLKKGQQTITFAVLGLIVIFTAFFLVRVITNVLGVDFFL